MKRILYNLVFLVAILNAIATVTTGYFPAGTLNPGTVRALIIGVPLIIFIARYYPSDFVSITIFIYLLYLFLLVFLSSDILWSFYMYIKIAIGFLMFPLGYYFVKDLRSYKKLMTSFAITLGLLLITVLISNIFDLGTSDYLDESFYFGVGRVNITTSIFILVLVAPVTLAFFKGNTQKILVLVFVAGLIVSLIGIKRSVLLSALISPMVYGFFTRYKKRFIKLFLGIALLLGLTVVVFPNAYSIFNARFDARRDAGNLELSEESVSGQARFDEYNLVVQSWIDGSLRHKMIGSEWLNDMYYFQSKRMLHTDYMVLLNGSGAIGLVGWFIILFLIFKEIVKYHKYLRTSPLFNTIYAISFCLLATQLFMSVSGSLYSIDVRCLLMLFWGSTVGLFRHTAIRIRSERAEEETKLIDTTQFKNQYVL